MSKYAETQEHTRMIIDFICDTRYEDIPEIVRERAKGRILDTIGVAYKAGAEPAGQIAKEYAKMYGGYPKATVVNAKLKTDIFNATFTNGILMHACDYDDHFVLSHPSIGVVPALLSIAELTGASGKEMITAFVIGIEIYTKIQQVTTTEPWYRGFHGSGIWASLSSVAAAGRLLSLDKDQMLMAWGIACSTFGGIKRNAGTHTKSYHSGDTASGGVRAALLAKMGFTSHVNAFEGENGYLHCFCTAPKMEFIEQLGKVWDLQEHPTLIKPHPSCGGTHAALNGMLELVRKYDIKEEDVAKIDVGMNAGGSQTTFFKDPKDIYEAKFSIHFVIAMALHYRRWGMALHTQEVVNDPAMKAIYKKVNFYMDEELDRSIPRDYTDYHAIVKVTLNDGTEYKIHAHPPVLDYADIKEKFYDCTCRSNIITDAHADKIIDLVRDLENYEIGDLISLIS